MHGVSPVRGRHTHNPLHPLFLITGRRLLLSVRVYFFFLCVRMSDDTFRKEQTLSLVRSQDQPRTFFMYNTVARGPSTPGMLPTASSGALPQYVLDKRERARVYSDAAAQSQHVALETSMYRLKGFCSYLQQCGDVIEGAVLALGVPTAHSLLKSLNEVCVAIDGTYQCYREASAVRKEECKLQEEVFESMTACYALLRDRNEAYERNLKHLLAERERKDVSMDAAVTYLHSVIAERTAWQDKCGYNNQQLPVEDVDFSGKCTAALEAMFEVRRLEKELAAEATGVVAIGSPVESKGLPIARLLVSSGSDASTLTKRWREIENTRHAMTCPSARLRYIPPAEEVQLLRDILAMGTGSTSLVHDIIQERKKLQSLRAVMMKECLKMKASVAEVKREMHVLCAYFADLIARGYPFVVLQENFLRSTAGQVEQEAMHLPNRWNNSTAEVPSQALHSSTGTASPLQSSLRTPGQLSSFSRMGSSRKLEHSSA